MIFAAGLGTRLKEETRSVPKALVDISGKPLLQIAIEKLSREGISEIVVNVHHFSESIISWIKSRDFDVPLHISDESSMLLDTGGGLKKASAFLKGDEPIVLYNVDIISDLDIREVISGHLRTGALATLVVRKRKTDRYFLFNQKMQLMGWTDKRTGEILISRADEHSKPDEFAFSGIHVISPGIFELLPDDVRFPITRWYLELSGKYDIHGFTDKSSLWMDVGKTHELEKARALFGS